MFESGQLPILGIMRGIRISDIEHLTKVCIDCGLKYIEVTMNTDQAPEIIHEMITSAADKLTIGAGTVLNTDDMDKALKAGAKFIVCPSIVEEVISQCRKSQIPVFPGALTPTEVHMAWNLGANMVKLFPASVFGPAYIKELKGPFDKIRIMAVGGVNETNIHNYFENRADAVAFGASIFNLKWMKDNRYDLVEEKLKALISSYKIIKSV